MSFPSDFATRVRLVKALLADESPLSHAQSGFAAGQPDPSRSALIRALLQGGDGRRSDYATPQVDPNRAALIRALLQGDGRRSGYDPNQPRVPAGNPDGGQWTSTGGTAGNSGAGAAETSGDGAADTPWSGGDWDPTDVSSAKKRRPRRERPPPPEGGPFKEFWQAIQDFREKYLKDLFGNTNEGVVACTMLNGREICGTNASSRAYQPDDDVRAKRLRATLIEKYPQIFRRVIVGWIPNDALFHAETTVLLRAANENGGTLAGQNLVVAVDDVMCPSCRLVLPKVGLELGNPTVTFVDRHGPSRIMQDGEWIWIRSAP
jgi:hypothetical protein